RSRCTSQRLQRWLRGTDQIKHLPDIEVDSSDDFELADSSTAWQRIFTLHCGTQTRPPRVASVLHGTDSTHATACNYADWAEQTESGNRRLNRPSNKRKKSRNAQFY